MNKIPTHTATVALVVLSLLLVSICSLVDAAPAPRKVGGGSKKAKSPLAAAAADAEEDEAKKDPTDDLIKYKGLLQCKMCEDAVESLTRKHFSTPLGVSAKSLHRSDPKVEVQRTLIARNTELVDGLCTAMMNDAEKEGDTGGMGTIQQHCQTIVNEEEEKLVRYVGSLYKDMGMEMNPAKLRLDDKGKVHYAAEAKVDKICKPHCSYKTNLKKSMDDMKEEMMQKHRELASNVSIWEIFSEAFALMAQYWYLSVGFFILVTGLFTFLQLKYISPLPKRPPPSLRPGLTKPQGAPSFAKQ